MEGSLVEHFQNLQFLLILNKNFKQFLYFQSRGCWCSRLECSPQWSGVRISAATNPSRETGSNSSTSKRSATVLCVTGHHR